MAFETVTIDKLIHGGQALGRLSDGRKVLVWNALPGETVEVELHKSKHSYAEGIAINVLKASTDREEPRDEAYLSTSPWQIMTFAAEQKAKTEILLETFRREHVALPEKVVADLDCVSDEQQWHYRNKMEYSFWADDSGLNLALFHRASHGKRIVSGSSIARPEIDELANRICDVLNQASIRGSQLKTVVVRSNMAGQTVAALYVKDPQFPELVGLTGLGQGVAVYFSNPKSPASIHTKTLYEYGDVHLTEKIMGMTIRYNVGSFFQINVPVFELALTTIKENLLKQPIVDFYSGVGTVGIPLGAQLFVENEVSNMEMLKDNLKSSTGRVVATSAENALEYIPSQGTLIVDPPRAGLHVRVTDRLLEVTPESVIYLSCNPVTQARDIARLQDKFEVVSLTGYNFFPRTPHIESLAVLRLRSS